MAATILSTLALLGTAAGAANSGAHLSSLDPEGVLASVMSNLPTTAATQASEQATQADQNDETETETEAEDDDNPSISASTEATPAGTTSAKPGWGCGDTNHEHSVPPGRPDATPPPGCDKAGSHGESGTHGSSSDHAQTSPATNASSHGKGKGR